jgi:integrase
MACITKRRGRYVIDCYDQNGKRYRKTMKAGTTKETAKKELREIEGKIERRTFTHEKKTQTFKEVAKLWIEYKETRCRETSWEMYQGHLNNHFAEMDERKIDRITTATVESFITARQSKGMALASLRKILVTLNQVMKYAVRHRLIDYNPVRDAERPKATGKVDESREMSILTPEQIRKLIEAEPDQKYRTLFLTAIMTGARQGEILGLKWSDIDFQRKQACINRTFNHGRFFEPKTRESIRKIDLTPMLVRELAAWKLKSGAKDDNLVFPSEAETETPIGCFNMVRRHYSPALKKAGIPRIKFHALRHTYASLLIDQKENIKYIQNQLGHTTPNITLSVYAHLMKGENQEAACRLENAIFEGTGHNLVTNEEKGLTVNG